MTYSSSIVRIGPIEDNVSGKLLKRALVSFFENERDKEGSSSSSSLSSSSPKTVIDESSGSTICISNKYFKAKVMLEEIEVSEWSTKTLGRDLKSKEDGVILVFDSLQSNPDLGGGGGNVGASSCSFDSLHLVHQKAEERYTCGDLLRLCVGVSLTALSAEEIRGENHEKEYSRRILWCLDRGYEYIEADISQEGQSKGHKDRDKEGFARIVEAIKGTVWSSAVMSKSKTKTLKESYHRDSLTLKKQEENNEERKSEQREEANPYEPPDPSMLGPVPTRDEHIMHERILNSESSAGENYNGLLIPENAENIGPNDMAKLRKDLETEQIFDRMEGFLKEASWIREASKNGTMTDEERRERAGDAAMALVNLMNQFGLEDDGSEVQDDSDDDSGIVR